MDALLLHGLGGGPADMEPLAQGLATWGVACHAPCLPGHGAGWQAFVHSHWSQWSAAAHEAYAALAGRGSEPPCWRAIPWAACWHWTRSSGPGRSACPLPVACLSSPRRSSGRPAPAVWGNGPCAGGWPGKPGGSRWRSAPLAARPHGRPRPGRGTSGWSAGGTWPRSPMSSPGCGPCCPPAMSRSVMPSSGMTAAARAAMPWSGSARLPAGPRPMCCARSAATAGICPCRTGRAGTRWCASPAISSGPCWRTEGAFRQRTSFRGTGSGICPDDEGGADRTFPHSRMEQGRGDGSPKVFGARGKFVPAAGSGQGIPGQDGLAGTVASS